MGIQTLRIHEANDSNNFYSTSIEMEGIITKEVSIRPHRWSNESEPTIAAIVDYIKRLFGLRKQRRSRYSYHYGNDTYWDDVSFNTIKSGVVIHIGESGFMVLFSKNKTRYSLNGRVEAKDLLLKALARTIYHSCFTKEGAKLNSILYKNLDLPENVSYALENRAPFHWYDEGRKVDVRLNVKQISETHCALEISDSIWASISNKDLNTYMNFYWKGNKRGSWCFLSPRNLWKKLLGEEPTDSQHKMMIAFLGQNRTQDIVEARAEELMADFENKNPDRIKIVKCKTEKANRTVMVVRGNIADWVLTDSRQKSNVQMVSTYLFTSADYTSSPSTHKIRGGYLSGPICIDNMTRHSSVGDQFCARALALLNDNITVNIVSTIKNYLDKDVHVEGQTDARLDWDNLEEILHEYLS